MAKNIWNQILVYKLWGKQQHTHVNSTQGKIILPYFAILRKVKHQFWHNPNNHSENRIHYEGKKCRVYLRFNSFNPSIKILKKNKTIIRCIKKGTGFFKVELIH